MPRAAATIAAVEVGKTMSFDHFREELQDFARDRDWEQFHHPKNLAVALVVEASELLEVFQWLSESESRTARSTESVVAGAREELADVLIYAIRLADVLGIDLEASIAEKIEANARRYPINASRGHARKAP